MQTVFFLATKLVLLQIVHLYFFLRLYVTISVRKTNSCFVFAKQNVQTSLLSFVTHVPRFLIIVRTSSSSKIWLNPTLCPPNFTLLPQTKPYRNSLLNLR